MRFQDEDSEGQDRANGQQAQPSETAASVEPEQPVSRLDRLVGFMLVSCCRVRCATLGMHVGLPSLCVYSPQTNQEQGCCESVARTAGHGNGVGLSRLGRQAALSAPAGGQCGKRLSHG